MNLRLSTSVLLPRKDEPALGVTFRWLFVLCLFGLFCCVFDRLLPIVPPLLRQGMWGLSTAGTTAPRKKLQSSQAHVDSGLFWTRLGFKTASNLGIDN